MQRDPRYDILFEPVRIGPVTARNRFYQVPHCNGIGYRDPSALARMRGIKAEGGWAVVCTEQVEVHHTSEITPFIELRLWDDRDIPALARIADAIHAHGSLAGIELAHNGMNGANSYSREVPMGRRTCRSTPSTRSPCRRGAMDEQDIRNLRALALGGGAPRHAAPASTSSTSMPATGSRSCRTSCRAGSTIAATSTAARSRTACGCCARSSRTPRTRSARQLRGRRAASPSTSCRRGAASHGREAEELVGMIGELPDLWDVMSATGRTTRAPRASPRKAARSRTSAASSADDQAGGRRRPLHLG